MVCQEPLLPPTTPSFTSLPHLSPTTLTPSHPACLPPSLTTCMPPLPHHSLPCHLPMMAGSDNGSWLSTLGYQQSANEQPSMGRKPCALIRSWDRREYLQPVSLPSHWVPSRRGGRGHRRTPCRPLQTPAKASTLGNCLSSLYWCAPVCNCSL